MGAIKIENFYFRNKNGVLTLHCAPLDAAGFEKHCFTTRKGGVSEGVLSGMNLSFSRECRENVEENYRRIANACGLSGNFVLTNQQHTDIVKEASVADGFVTFDDAVDGLVTDSEGICLTVFTADCVPVIIADPVTRSVACVHSGWRGTAKRITANAVSLMKERYGADPKDMLCAIGPCIRKCCYEVGKDVLDGFGDSRFFEAKQDGKFMLDLGYANTEVLKSAGIPSQNIFDCKECTYCKSDIYYSHRATNGRRGNLAAMIEL